MLPDQIGRLLSSYVDGELSPDQASAVRRLLKHSPDARLLLAEFRANSKRLNVLPQVPSPKDFSQAIVERLPARRVQPAPRHVVPVARTPSAGIPPWLGLASAAAVLLAVASGSYVYFSQRQLEEPKGEGLAEVQVAIRPDNVHDENPRVAEEPVRKSETATKAASSSTELRKPASASDKPPEPQPGSSPRPPLGSEPSTPETLKSIKLRVPLNLPLGKLVQAEQQEPFLHELRQEKGHQLVFECRDTELAMEHLLAAFQGSGVRVVLDQDAQARLNLKGIQTPGFYVYSESFSPEELLTILLKVQEIEAKAEAKKRGTAQFGNFVASVLEETDYRTFSRSLGVEITYLQSNIPWNPELDLRSPPQADTGKGLPKTPRAPESKHEQPKIMPIEPGEPAALVSLVDNRIHPTTPSPYVRLYFAGRSPEPRSDVKRVLLQLRVKKDGMVQN